MAKEIKKKAGVSGNSVAGKSYQIFTVSEELLAKVVEAVQAGEKEARSSGNIQSFEVFCHGFRANISLGRIMVVPAKVCNDKKNFPTALLHGALVRIFGWGGEEIADLVDKKIGESEFDEYSQADFDSLKESLFKDIRTGEEASLVVFAPNWMNSREYICFHFSKDADELKNNLRHQVFSAYYNPSVSSAFNALMTNVDTTKVDVTDITPKLSYPFLTENPLKQFPQLEKQGSYKKATILLNRKTADDITKQTLDPQELDVFDSLNEALENSLLPSADGAQGEGGFKAPEATPGVPREASAEAFGGKQAPPFGSKEKEACAPHETPFTNVGPGTEAHAEQEASAPAMKESVGEDDPEHRKVDGDPIGIAVDETGVPRSKADESKVGKKVAHIDANGICPGCKKAGAECSCQGCTCKAAAAANNPSNRQRNSAHPETLRVDPTRLSSAYSAAYNGGFVDKHNMPPQKVKDYITDKMGNNDEYAPHAAADHKKEIAAGGYGEDPLTRRSNEKWGSAEIPSKTKRSNVEIMASYVADVVATEIDEPTVAMSHKAKQARAKKESLLDKFRPKVAVELDIDSIWDAITEDMGPAPLVDVDTDPSNPAPSNTEDQGGWSETTEEGSESEAPKGRPNKKDVQDLPEAFRSTEPEDEKEISDSEAESQETDLENAPTQEEEHYHGASVDSKYADFVEDVAGEIESEEELPRMGCDQCQMMQIQGVPCHEQGCPNMGARWDSENGMWIPQRECFECGMEVDEDDPCCSAPVMDEADEARYGSVEKKADTADNGYDIDSAANPSTKENGPSDTVECHQDYNTERSEGTDRPKPEAGADIKQAGGVKRLYEDEMINREQLLKSIKHGDRVTIMIPAGMGRGGQEWKEATGTAVMHSAEPGGWVLNMGGRHGTPGLVNERNIVRVKKGKPAPGQERLGSGKKADTADNPANWKGGEGIIQPKTDAEIKDTTGPDAPPPGQKSSADISGDAAEAKAETVSPDTVDKDIQHPTVSVEEAGKKTAEDLPSLGMHLREPHEDWSQDQPSWVDKHSITCHNCGELADEREAVKLEEGELCAKCVKEHPELVPQGEEEQFFMDAPNDPPGYAKRVHELELEGLTTSDAQAVADAEFQKGASVKTAGKHEWKDGRCSDCGIRWNAEVNEDCHKSKESSDKTALHFMNDYDIEDALRVLGNDPVLGKAVRFLNEFKDQVNSHSDGWAYWRAPVAACGQLMTLIEQGMNAKRGQSFPETSPLINDKSIAKAMGPIKAFMTRKGLAAGMQMPKLAADISGDMSEAKSEVDYNKADVADDSAATDTVNPDHFAADKKACGESQPESVEFDFGAGDLADIVLVEDEEEK
jgi:hypothetical protein